jgi:hypothetical protein
MSRLFITRTDSGRNQFNYSEVLGGHILGYLERLLPGWA